jgi:predicted RNase H-like HicB family nuclease
MSDFRIAAHWDAEARVWWAESQDVKGLVAEADTLDALIADLRQTVPDLLQLNHGIVEPSAESITLHIAADRVEFLTA